MPRNFLNKPNLLGRTASMAIRLVDYVLPTCCALCHQTIKQDHAQTNTWLCHSCQPYLDALRLTDARLTDVCQQCAIPLEPSHTLVTTQNDINNTNKLPNSLSNNLSNNLSSNRANHQASEHNVKLCASCLKFPPAYTAIKCLYLYGYPLDNLINTCKEKNQPAIAHHLGVELANAFFTQTSTHNQLNDKHINEKHNIFTQDTLITSVPIHPKKWLIRQYNPAHIMALSAIKHAVKTMEKNAIHAAQKSDTKKITPNTKNITYHYRSNLLIKNTMTHTQKGLNRKARLKNLENSFSFNQYYSAKDKHIIVIDDVVTTTATAHIISSLLKKHGAKTITFYAIARTPKS